MAPDCLFPSSWKHVFVLTALIQLLDRCSGATYNSYDITSDSVCNRYNKREFSVYMSTPVILETRPETSEKFSTAPQPLSCTFEAEAKGGSKYGVTSVVQRMSFRSEGDSCVDYIQTIYKEEKREGIKIKFKQKKKKDKTRKVIKHIIKGIKNRDKRDSDDDDDKGSRICGDVLFGLHVDQNETMPAPFANPLPPTKPTSNHSLLASLFTEVQNPYQSLMSDGSEVDHKGEIKTHLYISNRMPRVNEKVKMQIVYTAYIECDGRRASSNLFHCGYGLCISRSLVNDGFVNCPFGDCIDETNCTHAKRANITAQVVRYKPTEPSTSKSGIMTTVIVALVLIVCCGAIYYCLSKRKKKQQKKRQEDDEENEEGEEDKGGAGNATTDFTDPNKQQSPPQPYPMPPGPGYVPPPGGQPGYYPMVPPQQGYPYPAPNPAPYMGQPMAAPPGYPGVPPPGGPGYGAPAPPEGATGPPASAYPAQGANYPPPNPYEAPVYPASAAPQQSGPPLPPGGSNFGFAYPPQQQPMPQAPYPLPSDVTAPQQANL